MKYKDLRDFIKQLEAQDELVRVTQEVDPKLEMTEICDRTLKAGGPAILFENPKGLIRRYWLIYLVRLSVLQWGWVKNQLKLCVTWVSCLPF